MSFWNPNLRFDDLKCTFATGAANAQKSSVQDALQFGAPGPPRKSACENPTTGQSWPQRKGAHVLRLVRIGMPHHQFEFVFAAPFCIETCNQNFQIFPLCLCVCVCGSKGGTGCLCTLAKHTLTHTRNELQSAHNSTKNAVQFLKCAPTFATHPPFLHPHGAR